MSLQDEVKEADEEIQGEIQVLMELEAYAIEGRALFREEIQNYENKIRS